MADEKSKPAKPEIQKKDEDPVGKVYDSRLMRRLGHYVRPYWIQATISSLAVSLKTLSDVAGPYLVKVAIDRYLTGTPGPATNWLTRRLPADAYHGITVLATIYMGALVSAYFFEFIQTYMMQWVGQKIMFDLRRDIFRHMQRMHIGFFDTHAVGRLVTRLTSDVDAINEMFTAGVLAIVDDFFNLTIMAVVMLTINWWLALIAFAVLPLILVVTRLFRDHVRESYRRVRAAIARINSFTQEHITGMSVVQLFNREQRAYQDFEDVNRLHMIAFKDTIFAYALYYPAVELLSAIAIALVIWRGGFGVLNGVVTIGVLAMFIQYSQRFWRPIQDLSDKYNILQAAMAACERIFKLLDTAPEIVNPAHPIAGDSSNRIEFRHVWFTYQKLTEEQQAAVAAAFSALKGHDFSRATELPEKDGALAPEGRTPMKDTGFSPYIVTTALDGALTPERMRIPDAPKLAAIPGIEWILKDVSFTIEPGQTIAIVGHTGAGKTTLTSLMMRFYDVTAGQILVDGVDLRQHDLNTLRRHFAVVLQDPFLFTGTLAENIRLGNEDITEATLYQAARDVNVLDFIETLPAKFDEPVQERGNSLSTGQKQLINFARALAYNPRILILDEATSSVDTDTELRIRGALERMVEGRTSVLIAHRLSTVQRADTILVMHKGQLREMGSHQELLAQRGLYWKLYQLQYKDQEIGVAAGPLDRPSTVPAV
ncbi:MAG TPA: ABC transporter ATP-binding protein [Terracidiphilus sp.]|nr:ABC transporter ATP-binding protein [Terracidiphilus sp.]